MAFNIGTNWDVRTTGSDSNGGGFNVVSTGTDYSQQNSPQVTYTDLVIDGTTNTKCTSAGTPFTSAHVGNIINITSGTGFTVQRVQVVSVTSAVATCDKSLGTLSSTGGNGKLGGSLLTIQTANTASASGNIIHIQAGTYTFTTTMLVAQATINFVGYNATHFDMGTRPLITTATSSTDLFTTNSTSGNQSWVNINFSNTASGTQGNCISQITNTGTTQTWVIAKCKFTGGIAHIIADATATHRNVAGITVIQVETTGSSATSIILGFAIATSLTIIDSYLHGNAIGVNAGVNLTMLRTIVAGSSGSGVTANGAINGVVCLDSCDIAGGSSNGLNCGSSVAYAGVALFNTIFYGNNAGINNAAASGPAALMQAISGNNAFKNTNPNTTWTGSTGDVTLTVDPFVNDASGNYALNATSGGGAGCKGTGTPGAFPGGLSTGSPDIGAVQSGAAAAGSAAFSFVG